MLIIILEKTYNNDGYQFRSKEIDPIDDLLKSSSK